ncbi:MAG: DUF4150 domain-containing protein [Polyangiaceae bacterium]
MFPVSTKAAGTCFAFPDVCLVPAAPNPVPTPFPNTGQCTDATGTVDSVLIENKEVLVETSSLSQSSGDEAGTGGGVMSGTFRGVVKFKTASSKVYAKGKRVILFGATSAHNGDNANMPMGSQIVPSQARVLAGG